MENKGCSENYIDIDTRLVTKTVVSDEQKRWEKQVVATILQRWGRRDKRERMSRVFAHKFLPFWLMVLLMSNLTLFPREAVQITVKM